MPTPRLPIEMAAVIHPTIMPDLFAGARVHRPDMVGNREIENAVYFERRRFDLRSGRRRAVTPTFSVDTSRRCASGSMFDAIDLRKRAEPPPRVIAVVSGPSVRWRLQVTWPDRVFERQPDTGSNAPASQQKGSVSSSFQSDEISQEIMHVGIGVFVKQFAMTQQADPSHLL